MSSFHRSGSVCCLMELYWWQVDDVLLTIQCTRCWFYRLIFDFSIAGIHTCCWMWIPDCIMWQLKMCSMHILFISILHIFVCTDGHFQSHFSDHDIFKAQLVIARSQQFMLIRATCPAVVHGLGFKCIICDAEFTSRRGADCHRRHPKCIGTACADPSNIRSLSLTERPDVSVGILRHHSAAPLGQSLNIIYLP